MAARAHKMADAPREHIFCPRCAKAYRIDADSLGAEGRQVRCKTCDTIWFEPPKGPQSAARVLSPHFASKLKLYLNHLPPLVRQSSAKTTHAIKSFLMREGPAGGAVGHANGIRVQLPHFKNAEFLWDAAAKMQNPDFPGEDVDLIFVAESENQCEIDKIIEDANKLPIVRADARLMFFRAHDAVQLEYTFGRLRELFQRHRKTEIGDVYVMAGLDLATLAYAVRKLTIGRDRSNIDPWEEF
jgi:predicted Zn finger-like uncharacterized protein